MKTLLADSQMDLTVYAFVKKMRCCCVSEQEHKICKFQSILPSSSVCLAGPQAEVGWLQWKLERLLGLHQRKCEPKLYELPPLFPCATATKKVQEPLTTDYAQS